MSIKHLCEEGSRRKKKYIPPIKIGDKIDFLTLIEYIPLEGVGHRRGLFRCDCGNEITRILTMMLKPVVNKKSCGCQTEYDRRKGRPVRTRGLDGDLANMFIRGGL